MSETQQAPAADINAIMTQAQVFASAWALMGSRHQGDELANAEEQRSQLRTMLANAIPDSYASKAQPVNQQMLAALKELRNAYQEFMGLPACKANAAIAAAEAAQPVAVQGDVEKDAARYRLLRHGRHWSVIDGIGNELRGEALDAATDAAAQIGGAA